MYKRITLEKFGRKVSCKVPDYQFKFLEEEIERLIKVLNKGIEEGKDFLGYFMTSYDDQLSGMWTACIMIGIDIEIKYERTDEIKTKGDEVGTNVIN